MFVFSLSLLLVLLDYVKRGFSMLMRILIFHVISPRHYLGGDRQLFAAVLIPETRNERFILDSFSLLDLPWDS